MNLDKESIDEFKKLWRQAFRENLTDGQARLIAGQFLSLYMELYFGPESKREEDSE